MNRIFERMSPSITSMIRMDHTHVMSAFHRFRADLSNQRKSALVDHVCLALEIHAQLEEEIFYPALREVLPDNEQLQKSQPEHDEMKSLIAALRSDDPDSPAFDETFLRLMRTVIHHVADEESILLPAAERLLADELSALGAQMTARRMKLLGPHAGEAALTGAQTFPQVTAALALGGVAIVTLLAMRNSSSQRRSSRWN